MASEILYTIVYYVQTLFHKMFRIYFCWHLLKKVSLKSVFCLAQSFVAQNNFISLGVGLHEDLLSEQFLDFAACPKLLALLAHRRAWGTRI